MIKEIHNGCLNGLNQLKSLDLSNNQISKIQNISHLTQLETLNLANIIYHQHMIFKK